MKIYVVTEGEYSDYHICAMFSTEEAAEEYRQVYCEDYGEPGGEVEEWEVDDESIYNGFPKGLAAWCVNMNEDGSINYVRLDGTPDADSRETYGKPDWYREEYPPPAGLKCYINYEKKYGPWQMGICVLARNKEHAIKIVNEKRTQLIAENQWGKS